MLETIAWLGTCFLAAHALPQVYKSLTEGAEGLSWGMLVLWWLGVACTLPYVIQVQNWPVVAAHTINFFACSTLLYAKISTGFVAQLEEHLTCNEDVAGSTPVKASTGL
jgi:uncharacterized protein with PQ loop repeat